MLWCMYISRLSSLRRLAAHRIGGAAVTLAATLAGYVALAWCGQQFLGAGSGIASFWPPNGLIVSLLVLLPARLRPWVAAAVLPGELVADSLQGQPVLAALGWGTTNLLEAVVAVAILMRVARRSPLFDTQRDFFALAVAAVSAPLAGGLLGAAVSYASYGGSYGRAWLTWWLGDATGILLVVPLVVSLARPGALRMPLERLAGLAEVGVVIGVAAGVFGFTTTMPIEFLVLPPLVLLALRQGLRLTAVAGVSFAIVATIFTGHGRGPLSYVQDVALRVMGLQAFILTTAFVAFLICATIAERRRAEAAFVELATHDSLTGLANRRLFMEQLDRVASRRDRSSESAAVLYFDLDDFKKINDGLGHAAGDAVLVEVGRRLAAAAVREGDLVARIGGDEFAALLEPVDGIRGAELSARRIAEVLERPFERGDVSIAIGVSVGAALVGSNGDLALHRADLELYRDKADSDPRPAVGTRTRSVVPGLIATAS